ncbi:MAG: SLC13 family permease [Anaerolineales bacterium]
MSWEIGMVFGILATAMVLFITGWLRSDAVAVLVLVSLVVTGLLDAETALSGFSSEAVIATAGLLVLSAGLVRSGAVIWITERIEHLATGEGKRLMVMSSMLPGFLSGFISDIGTVSLFIPVILRLARKKGIPHTHLLLPLAMAALAGGNFTLIGSSHNLVVDSLLRDTGAPSLNFLTLFPVGLALVSAFTLYALLLAPVLLPERQPDPSEERGKSTEELMRTYDMQERLWELSLKPESHLVGQNLAETNIGNRYGLSVLSMLRNHEVYPARRQAWTLEAGDVLLVVGRRGRVERLAEAADLDLLGPPRLQEEFTVSGAEMVEVVVPPRSAAVGQTLAEMGFRGRHGLTGIGLWRVDHPVRTDVGFEPLKEGDALLLYGSRKNVRSFDPEPKFLWLSRPRREEAPRELRHLAPWATLIMLLVVLSAAFDLLPIAVGALGGGALMLLLGVLTPREVYESVEWRTVLLIGGMYPLGLAMEESGAAGLLSTLVAGSVGQWGPLAVLVGIVLLALMLTQVMHGAAVAVIMTPVALDTAALMGVNPRPLAVAVIIGASATYLLPMGHPAPLLVQKPGSYRPLDYLRYGAGLLLLTVILSAVLLPLLWPF